MHAHGHANLGHLLQHRLHLVKICHAAGGICCRPGRIEFGRRHQSRGMGRGQVLGVGLLGQIERHQRLEI